jgi:hypothetical protein
MSRPKFAESCVASLIRLRSAGWRCTPAGNFGRKLPQGEASRTCAIGFAPCTAKLMRHLGDARPHHPGGLKLPRPHLEIIGTCYLPRPRPASAGTCRRWPLRERVFKPLLGGLVPLADGSEVVRNLRPGLIVFDLTYGSTPLVTPASLRNLAHTPTLGLTFHGGNRTGVSMPLISTRMRLR